MNDELVKRLRNVRDGHSPSTGNYHLHSGLRELLSEAIAALSAQQEPVATVHRVSVGNFEPDVIWHKEWPAHMTKLYTAPASGVKEGMMRAAEICMEWAGKLSQGAGYALQIVAGEIVRAADQVNAEGRIESLQLPPLNEIMHHAVRGLELDFGSGESLFQRSIDDDTLDPIWESINTALRCAKVSPSAPPSASQPDTVAVPIHQLEHWAEYWNGSANEKAMSDALEHILGEVDDLLRAAQEAK